MTDPPGYLLPEGECYTDELACTIVFYPDKEEYRRALLGSIVYLSNWLAWERDSDKRGKDAARAWKNAVDETLECWTMTCFEELMADVARIRTLLENRKDCCDPNVVYYPTEEPTTEIIPLVGDPPAFYGETAVADWDEWLEHVCHNAHLYVDYLKDTASEIKDAVSINSIYLGLIAAALAVLSFSGVGLPIAFGLAALVVTGLVTSATLSTFSDTADDFETARDSIVCAIVAGTSLPDAIEAALSSGTDWDLFYQWIDYDAATAIMYEGGWDDEFLPTEMRDDCVCLAEVMFLFQWPTDIDGWTSTAGLVMAWEAGQYISVSPGNQAQWKSGRWWTWDDLETRFGLSLPADYDQLKFKFYNNPGTGSLGRWLWYFRIYDSVDAYEQTPTYDSDDFTGSEWHEIIYNFSSVFESGAANKAIYLAMYRYGNVAQGQRIWFDDFGLYLK